LRRGLAAALLPLLLGACLAHAPAYPSGTPGVVGLALGAGRGGELVVASVHPGTPAARAGVRAGDRVLAIDGRDASALGLIGASARLAGAPGTRLTLRVATGDRAPRRIRLVREAPPGAPAPTRN
jgi:carboxyl-terminal processing protease